MRVLTFLRLVDEDGNLSLTHACLVFAMVCIWVGKPISLPEFGALALSLGAYQLKKYLANREPTAPAVDLSPMEAKLRALEANVAAVMNQPALARFGLTPKKP